MPEQLLREWGLSISAIIGAAIGYGELRWRARTNSKDIESEKEDRKAEIARLEGQIRDSEGRVDQRLDRLEDNMNDQFKELQSDIKTLLTRQG